MKQHNDKLLITFGCSWTFGVGCNYVKGMSESEFKKNAWNQHQCDSHSFRGILSKKLGFDNLNFSLGGSSNQAQFRLAENFFCSPMFVHYQKIYSSIKVLWGITSVLRGEFYCVDSDRPENVCYTVSNKLLSKCILAHHLDLEHEISMIEHKIRFWNQWFALHNIKNYWFDTFNHHDYARAIVKYHERTQSDLVADYKKCAGPDWPTWGSNVQVQFDSCHQDIKDEILDSKKWPFCNLFLPKLTQFVWYDLEPRDLMSQLAMRNGFTVKNETYHASNWSADCERVKFLVDCQLINEFSKHPTTQAHCMIADYLEPYVRD